MERTNIETKMLRGENIGWRENARNREQALRNARELESKRLNFEELVKSGLARKVIEKLPCRAIRIHYEMI